MPKINIERFPLFQPEPEAQASASVESPIPEIPEDAIIVLPVRNVVLYPGIVLPLTVGRKASVAAAQEAARNERPIGVVLQRDAEVENPKPEDLYGVGAVASILRYVTGSDKAHHLICQGEERFRVKEFLSGYPFLVARIERLEEREEMTNELEARMHRLKERARESLELIPQAPAELGSALEAMTSPSALADMIASFMDIKPAEKQEVLETFDIQARLDRVLKLLNQRIEVMRLSHEIGQQTKEAMDERQREYLLREQLRTIQKELGEDEGKDAEIEELARAIDDAGMPKEVEEEARKELRRLERMPEAAAEYSMSARIWTGCWRCPGRWSTRRISTSRPHARRWTGITTAWRRSSAGFWSIWPCASSIPRGAVPFCASWGLRAWARPPWARVSPGPWG